MAQNLKIYVSQQSFDDEDEYEIVSSNIDLLNALLNEYLNEDEIHPHHCKAIMWIIITPKSITAGFPNLFTTPVRTNGFSHWWSRVWPLWAQSKI